LTRSFLPQLLHANSIDILPLDAGWDVYPLRREPVEFEEAPAAMVSILMRTPRAIHSTVGGLELPPES
jgi:hypothetical protein